MNGEVYALGWSPGAELRSRLCLCWKRHAGGCQAAGSWQRSSLIAGGSLAAAVQLSPLLCSAPSCAWSPSGSPFPTAWEPLSPTRMGWHSSGDAGSLGWLAWWECAALKQNWFEMDYLHVCSHLCNFLLPFGIAGGENAFPREKCQCVRCSWCGLGLQAKITYEHPKQEKIPVILGLFSLLIVCFLLQCVVDLAGSYSKVAFKDQSQVQSLQHSQLCHSVDAGINEVQLYGLTSMSSVYSNEMVLLSLLF